MQGESEEQEGHGQVLTPGQWRAPMQLLGNAPAAVLERAVPLQTAK